jgi:hypothetical protein
LSRPLLQAPPALPAWGDAIQFPGDGPGVGVIEVAHEPCRGLVQDAEEGGSGERRDKMLPAVHRRSGGWVEAALRLGRLHARLGAEMSQVDRDPLAWGAGFTGWKPVPH